MREIVQKDLKSVQNNKKSVFETVQFVQDDRNVDRFVQTFFKRQPKTSSKWHILYQKWSWEGKKSTGSIKTLLEAEKCECF